jgi:hypothetical protein
MIRKAGLLLLVIGAVVFIYSGCNLLEKNKIQTEWKPEAPVDRQPYVHTVKYPKETMRIISKWYTGDVKNWEAIAGSNPYIDNEKMAVGTKVFIPEKLLKTTEPLSEDFIVSFNQEGKPVQENKPTVKEEEKAPVLNPKPVPNKKDEDFDLVGPK